MVISRRPFLQTPGNCVVYLSLYLDRSFIWSPIYHWDSWSTSLIGSERWQSSLQSPEPAAETPCFLLSLHTWSMMGSSMNGAEHHSQKASRDIYQVLCHFLNGRQYKVQRLSFHLERHITMPKTLDAHNFTNWQAPNRTDLSNSGTYVFQLKISNTFVISQQPNLHDVINIMLLSTMFWNVQMINVWADYDTLVTNPRGGLCTFLPIAPWYQSHQEHNAVKHRVEQGISYVRNKESKISLYGEHWSPRPSGLSPWLTRGNFLLHPSCAMVERQPSSLQWRTGIRVVSTRCHMMHRLQAKTKEHFLSLKQRKIVPHKVISLEQAVCVDYLSPHLEVFQA